MNRGRFKLLSASNSGPFFLHMASTWLLLTWFNENENWVAQTHLHLGVAVTNHSVLLHFVSV